MVSPDSFFFRGNGNSVIAPLVKWLTLSLKCWPSIWLWCGCINYNYKYSTLLICKINPEQYIVHRATLQLTCLPCDYFKINLIKCNVMAGVLDDCLWNMTKFDGIYPHVHLHPLPTRLECWWWNKVVVERSAVCLDSCHYDRVVSFSLQS